ncbi:hypothetical protein B484DRAFT_418439, partial [Ochromonadaceae sp. CCMP2298]
MEEAEQPQGRRCKSQGGQRTSGRVREPGGMAAEESGDEGEDGGAAEREERRSGEMRGDGDVGAGPRTRARSTLTRAYATRSGGDPETLDAGGRSSPGRKEGEGTRSRVKELMERRERGAATGLGRPGGRTGMGRPAPRSPAAPDLSVLARLDSLSDEELDVMARAAGWRTEWREADPIETGGAQRKPSTHQPQVPSQGAHCTLGQGDRQQVGPGQHGGPPPSTNGREADGSKTGGAGQEPSPHQPRGSPQGAPPRSGQGDRQQLAAEDGLGARHSAGRGTLAGDVTVSRQVLPAGVTDKLETYAGQVLPPDETDKHETFVGQVLPQGGIMGTGQKREAAGVKGVTNQHGSKGEGAKGYREEAQQDKMGWSAHGADGAADVPLPASADGKWAPGEYVVATVVQGWIRAAASKGYRDDGFRPPSGCESDSDEGVESEGSGGQYTAAEMRYMSGEGRLEDIHPFVCPRCDPTGPRHDSGPGCDLCAVLPNAELNRQHRELFNEHGGLYLCPPHEGAGGQYVGPAGTEYRPSARTPAQNVSMISERGDEGEESGDGTGSTGSDQHGTRAEDWDDLGARGQTETGGQPARTPPTRLRRDPRDDLGACLRTTAGTQQDSGASNGSQGSEGEGEQKGGPSVSIIPPMSAYPHLFTSASDYHALRPGRSPLSMGDGLFTQTPIRHNEPILSYPGEVITMEQYNERARDGYGGYAVQLNSEYCVDGHQAHHDKTSLAGDVNSPHSAVPHDPAAPAVAAVANARLVVRRVAVSLYRVTIVAGSAADIAEDAVRVQDGLAALSRPPIPSWGEILMDYSSAYVFPTALTDTLPPMDISAAEEVRVMFAAETTAEDWAGRASDDPTDS